MGSKLGDALILTGLFGFMAILGVVVYLRFAPDINKAIEIVQKGNLSQFQGALKDNPFMGSNSTSTAKPFASRAGFMTPSLSEEEEILES